MMLGMFDALMTQGFLANADLLFWFICGLSVFLVAIAKSGFGGSMGALSAPLLLTLLPAKTALAILLPLYLVCDVWAVMIWHRFAVRRFLIIMVVAAAIGQYLGYLLFAYIDDGALKAVIGVVALVTAARYFWRIVKPVFDLRAAARRRLLRKKFTQRAVFWSGLSGFSSFVSLTGGIPVQVLMLPLRLHRFFLIGTLAYYFFFINLLKLPFFFNLEMLTPQTLFVSVCMLPLIPLGVVAGKWMATKLSDKWFYHISHIALALLGLRLVIGWLMS
ncbi:sulfite exporter TauE/SafE family protein [Alphaproteobacteria bacterium]|nr:sulfite exporter TauE/SafE family protein [Alphaproteobacteria bacterium]